jgi:tetratricopeptide (TPR) repeat protein
MPILTNRRHEFGSGYIVIAAMTFLTCLAAGCGRQQTSVPLEYGWGYASAIANDAKDRARKQQEVALAYLENGNIDRSIEMGRQIENWRKAVVIGESAARLARKGRTEEAAQWINKMKRFVSANTEDWRRVRAMMHISEAEACLGEYEKLTLLEKAFQNDKNQLGRISANKALYYALHGDTEKALQTMDSVAAQDPLFDELVWRIQGFLMLVESGELSSKQEKTAIAEASGAVAKMPGNKKLDLMLRVAETARTAGLDRDHSLLEEATEQIRDCKFPPNIKAPLVARSMVAWARRGKREKVAELGKLAGDSRLSESLLTTDGSRFFSLLGEAYHIAGDKGKALASFHRAIEVTEKQPNVRPRAMSAVNICLSVNRCGFEFQKLKKDLDGLAEGLNVQVQ